MAFLNKQNILEPKLESHIGGTVTTKPHTTIAEGTSNKTKAYRWVVECGDLSLETSFATQLLKKSHVKTA